jgi:NhaP-type Na+/H+ and K+/H+ antiporter
MSPLASTTWSLAAISGVVLAFIALESLRPRLLPPAFAFTVAGLIVGGEVLGWLDITPEASSLRLLAEATLALVLFSDASRIDLRALRNAVALPARLLGIGLPLTIVAGTVAAVLVFPDLSLPEAAALAIVLAATDAALGQAVVTDERLPASIREGLNVERPQRRPLRPCADHRADARRRERRRALRLRGRAGDRGVDRLRRADGRGRRRRRGVGAPARRDGR